jgi:hypothetical protein
MYDGLFWGPNAQLSSLHTDLVGALRTKVIVLAIGEEFAKLRNAENQDRAPQLVST